MPHHTPLGLNPSDPRGVDPGRRTEDFAALDGAPWPVKAIAILGGMTCIACFLVWFLASQVTTALGEIKTGIRPLDTHIEGARKLGETLEQLERDHRDSNFRMEGYMRLICEQGAKTKQELRDCQTVR